MFFLNVGYKWTAVANLDELSAAVFLPTGNIKMRMARSTVSEPGRVLFDPQLYLAGIPAHSCTKVCTRLASYPWFQVPDLPEQGPDQKVREWEQEVRGRIEGTWPGKVPEGASIAAAALQAVQFQLDLGCSHVILPAPLLEDREDEAQTAADWIDAGLEAAAALDVGQPVLATVALLDSVLNDESFEATGFVETVVDQMTARSGLDGVYMLVVQSATRHPFDIGRRELKALCHLSRAFSRAGYAVILTNFVDVFGLVCMAFGASGFATGPSQSLRRISLQALEDEGGGRVFPHYYAHRSVTEYLTESDLDRVVEKRLVRRIKDSTSYSANLLAALEQGRSARDLPDWVETRNNYRRAHMHFLSRMVKEGRRLGELPGVERGAVVRGWLEDAEANALYIAEKLGGDMEGHVAPTGNWLALYDELTG